MLCEFTLKNMVGLIDPLNEIITFVYNFLSSYDKQINKMSKKSQKYFKDLEKELEKSSTPIEIGSLFYNSIFQYCRFNLNLLNLKGEKYLICDLHENIQPTLKSLQETQFQVNSIKEKLHNSILYLNEIKKMNDNYNSTYSNIEESKHKLDNILRHDKNKYFISNIELNERKIVQKNKKFMEIEHYLIKKASLLNLKITKLNQGLDEIKSKIKMTISCSIETFYSTLSSILSDFLSKLHTKPLFSLNILSSNFSEKQRNIFNEIKCLVNMYIAEEIQSENDQTSHEVNFKIKLKSLISDYHKQNGKLKELIGTLFKIFKKIAHSYGKLSKSKILECEFFKVDLDPLIYKDVAKIRKELKDFVKSKIEEFKLSEYFLTKVSISEIEKMVKGFFIRIESINVEKKCNKLFETLEQIINSKNMYHQISISKNKNSVESKKEIAKIAETKNYLCNLIVENFLSWINNWEEIVDDINREYSSSINELVQKEKEFYEIHLEKEIELLINGLKLIQEIKVINQMQIIFSCYFHLPGDTRPMTEVDIENICNLEYVINQLDNADELPEETIYFFHIPEYKVISKSVNFVPLITSNKVKSEEEEDWLKENFGIDSKSESIVKEYRCSYVGHIRVMGKIHLTKKSLLFFSYFNDKTVIFGKRTKIRIPFEDITNIQWIANPYQLKNTLQFYTDQSMIEFTDFLNTEKKLKYISKLIDDFREKLNAIPPISLNEMNPINKELTEHEKNILKSIESTSSFLEEDERNVVYEKEFKCSIWDLASLLFNRENKFLKEYEKENKLYDFANEEYDHIPDFFTSLNEISNRKPENIQELLKEYPTWKVCYKSKREYKKPIKPPPIPFFPNKITIREEINTFIFGPHKIINTIRITNAGVPFAENALTKQQIDIIQMPFVKNGEREVTAKLRMQVKILLLKDTIFKNVLLDQGKKEVLKSIENVFVPLFESILSEKIGKNVNDKSSSLTSNK